MKTSLTIILNSENIGLPHALEGEDEREEIGIAVMQTFNHSLWFPAFFFFNFCSLCLTFLKPNTLLTSRGETVFLLHLQELDSGLQLPLLPCSSAFCPLEICWSFLSTEIPLSCFLCCMSSFLLVLLCCHFMALRRDGRWIHNVQYDPQLD